MNLDERKKVAFDIAQNGPTRVVINKHADGVSPRRAALVEGISPDIIFIRHDGWSLGAPREFEIVAYKLWEKEWDCFVDIASRAKVKDISEYQK